MRYELAVKRRRNAADTPSWQHFYFETELKNATVANALTFLNQQTEPTDTDGKKCDKIVWECSCLQKKCGACAMVINGRPQLACGAVLAEQKTDVITVEPLRKFPVIADLMVDRDKMMDNLRTLQLWLNGEAQAAVKKSDLLYEASGCLQCGCCLEVCPNFCTEGDFYGMAALVPASRLLEEMSREESRALRKNYSKNIYNGCGKSLACRNICPAGLDIDALMVNSNAALLWKMWRRAVLDKKGEI